MKQYTKRGTPQNNLPDLFDWHRERELRCTNLAAQKIARQYGVSFHHAKAIATIAGIGPEVAR